MVLRQNETLLINIWATINSRFASLILLAASIFFVWLSEAALIYARVWVFLGVDMNAIVYKKLFHRVLLFLISGQNISILSAWKEAFDIMTHQLRTRRSWRGFEWSFGCKVKLIRHLQLGRDCTGRYTLLRIFQLTRLIFHSLGIYGTITNISWVQALRAFIASKFHWFESLPFNYC